MSNDKGLLWANRMESYLVYGRGIKSCFGALVSCGFQVSSNSSAFPRSEIGLAIVLYLDSLFTPPKVSLSEMRTYNVPFQLILVADCIAPYSDKCCRLF